MKLKLSELRKLENNPRIITKEDYNKLKESIQKFGFIEGRPMLISNRTGENIILGGNQRYEVCKNLGIEEVPVFIFENLTEEEEKEIIIRDNINNGEWDFEKLANEWDNQKIQEWGVKLKFDEDINFDEIEGNENRQKLAKVQKIVCPNCSHSFSI